MQFDEGVNPERAKQSPDPPSVPVIPDNWASFFDATNVGFVICDEDLRYVKVNEALAQMNGVPVAAHLGRSVSEVLGDAAARIEPAYRRVLSTGEPCQILS